jgi:lipoyl synthase
MQEKALRELLARAFAARQSNFPPLVEFVYPRRTLPVRSTGGDCSLNCAHCSGRYLKGMLPLTEALKRREGPETSYLVSGGSDLGGRVPHLERLADIVQLSQKGPLNLHTGLVGEEEAAILGEIARVVSFDFVVDEDTIRDVYGLQATGDDFVQSYRWLRRFTRVVPHICIGLKGGRIKGEYRALEALRGEGAEAISFIVFIPTPGTPLEHCPPPPVSEVAGFLATARIMFPATPLFLGCMRPGGSYRRHLDSLALQGGINKIVHPAPPTRKLAAELGLIIRQGEECCSL